MAERISLGKRRAEATKDSHNWSAEEMLEDVLDAIRTKKIKPEQIVVSWFTEADEHGQKEFNRMIAGATWMEYVALMAFAFKRACDGGE